MLIKKCEENLVYKILFINGHSTHERQVIISNTKNFDFYDFSSNSLK